MHRLKRSLLDLMADLVDRNWFVEWFSSEEPELFRWLSPSRPAHRGLEASLVVASLTRQEYGVVPVARVFCELTWYYSVSEEML